MQRVARPICSVTLRGIKSIEGRASCAPMWREFSTAVATAGESSTSSKRPRTTAKPARLAPRDDGHERHNKVKGVRTTSDESFNIHLALDEVKANAWARFDEGVDIAIQLNVDPRKPNQNIRGIAKLPNGSGRTVRVAVFATGDSAAEAKAAGADLVGSDELVESIQKGNLDFDALIATPELMGMVGKLGRILGPRGLMPNPKLGTVTKNVGDAVKESKAGAIQFRVEKKGIIHCGVGRVSFTNQALIENIRSLMVSISDAKPEGLKGAFVQQVKLTSTMGPGVAVDLPSADPSSSKFMLHPDELK